MDNTSRKHIAALVRGARHKKGLSKEDLIKLIGYERISSTVNTVKGLKAKVKSGKKVRLKWMKQSNAKKYEIQISKTKDFNDRNLISKKTSKNDVNIKCKSKGKNYVRVRAIDKDGNVGRWSSVKKVKIKK
ncbi:hypothetical protein [Butyrivibrio sp. LC3010]|uniref:hypothetical protein n=1 Tax=Butyrivibrio sp. LC3010 TaxID=1280680 RepID=UPI00041BA458|nr:hypothetical protein [Butyrivibrio sp. LC3010]